MESSEAKFRFSDFIIKKSLIEKKDSESGSNFNINIQPEGKIFRKDQKFQLELKTIIKDNNDVVNIEVVTLGNFYFDQEIASEQLHKYFFLNAPAIMFPYIRAYITTLTSLSGYKPIILLPTLNLSSIGEQLKENTSDID